MASVQHEGNGGGLMSIATGENRLRVPALRPGVNDPYGQTPVGSLAAELLAARKREADLLGEKRALSQRQIVLAQEFEHRLLNGLQLIVTLLSLQSRKATTPEVAAQLMIAAQRVTALGRVHRQLHCL